MSDKAGKHLVALLLFAICLAALSLQHALNYSLSHDAVEALAIGAAIAFVAAL